MLLYVKDLGGCLRGCKSSSRGVGGSVDHPPRRVYYVPKYRDQYVNICSFFIIRLFTDYFYLLTSCEAVNLETAPFGDAALVAWCGARRR